MDEPMTEIEDSSRSEGEKVVREWTRRPTSTPSDRAKRYRLEVYEPQTADGKDRTLHYKSLFMAKLNAFLARYIGAARVVIVDTQPGR